jgi:hypothetical protein
MTTVNDLTFHGERAVLLSHRNGQPALWVISEEFDIYNSPVEGYTVNDEYLKLPINENEDLDYIVGAWKDAVEWEDGVRPITTQTGRYRDLLWLSSIYTG